MYSFNARSVFCEPRDQRSRGAARVVEIRAVLPQDVMQSRHAELEAEILADHAEKRVLQRRE